MLNRGMGLPCSQPLDSISSAMNANNGQPEAHGDVLGIPSTLQPCLPFVPADRTVAGNDSGPFISHFHRAPDGLITLLVYRTELPVVGGILIRRKDESDWREQMAYPDYPNYDHGMGITGLEPGCEYEYRWFHLDGEGGRVVDHTPRAFRVPAPIRDFPLDAGPWLFNADTDRISIGWRSSVPVAGGVQYRVRGSGGEWTERLVQSNGTLVLDGIAQIIDLKGLEPGTEYEYRLAVYDLATGSVITHGGYTFRTLREGGVCRALFLTDTHSNWRFIRNAIHFTDAGKAADFIAFGGDNVWDGMYSPDGQNIIDDIVNPVTAEAGHSVPIAVIRGNHEWGGLHAADWTTWLRAQSGRTWYAFTDGPCYFILLECGPMGDYGRNRYCRELMEEQRIWLRDEALASEACGRARFRIVLVHNATHGQHGESDAWREMFAASYLPILNSEDPARRIHLMIAGHMHEYSRCDADSDTFYVLPHCGPDTKNPTPSGKGIRYAVVSNDGPVCHDIEYSALAFYADDDKIVINAFDQDMRVFDSFSLDRDGRSRTSPEVPVFRH